MTTEQKKQALANYLLTAKMIVEPNAMEAEMQKMAQLCPEATAKEKGLVDVYDKAYEVYLIQTGQQGDGAGAGTQAPSVTETKTPVMATAPTSAISDVEKLAISKTLIQQKENRAAVSANTTIENLVLDRPAPADYIPKNTKGLIKAASFKKILEKIEKGEYVVMDDDTDPAIEVDKRVASKTNFGILKDAYENNKPVDVYVGQLNTKPIGYLVKKGTNVGTESTVVQMNRDKLEKFLTMEAAGYVLASEKKPGAKLRYIQPKKSATQIGNMQSGRVILADANKKAAIAAGSYVVSKAASGENEEQTCKSELQFRVVVNKPGATQATTADGKPKVVKRLIRVSLSATLPKLNRLPEYIDEFGTGERESNADLLDVPTGKQAQAIATAQMNAIAELKMKANQAETAGSVADIAAQLAAFEVPASNAATPDVQM